MRTLLLAALVALLPVSAPAETADATPAPGAVGEVTGLPLPRFVSVKAAEGYVRRGPSRDHRIDWVFKRRGLPVRIVDEYGHWRRVEDADGMGGWMHYSLLSGVRTAMVRVERIDLSRRAGGGGKPAAILEHGVIGRVETCVDGWCRMAVEDRDGWIPATALWGVGG